MIEFNDTKIFTDNIDHAALGQLHELDKTGVFKGLPVRIMPDVHAGAGCVIGFTAPVGDKIIPNLVGVDIACGMLCVYVGKVDMDYGRLDKVIRENIPSGRNVGDFSKKTRELIGQLRCFPHLTDMKRLECSLGSLGGGNHFIEIDEDDEGGKYLVIHSGSRNLGKQVAEYYQNLAVKQLRSVDSARIIAEKKASGNEKDIAAALKALRDSVPKLPANLCYLTGQSLEDYLFDVKVCTEFAYANRYAMARKIIRHCGLPCDEKKDSFTTLHNYIGEDGYIRKGAICADKGKTVLIPLNMRDGCIIGVGKGNPDWNYSAPHGAGRIMSRGQAKERLRLEEYEDAMRGIYSSTVSYSTIDEAPFAYKPSEEIIELVKDTVDITKIIKPVYNYKASE